MIRYYFSIIAVSFIIFNLNCQSTYKTPNRELAIILDLQKMETVDETLSNHFDNTFMVINPKGISAISITALIALNQQASPILINSSIIENILNHKKIFFDFMYLNESALIKKYQNHVRFRDYNQIREFKEHANYIKKVYPAINEELKKLIKNNNQTDIEQALLKIAENPKFNLSSAPAELKSMHTNYPSRAKHGELIIYTLCYHTPMDTDKYIIKKISKDFYLFIPKSYILKYFKNLDIKKFSEVNKDKSLSDLELKFGLKINHFENVNSLDDILANKKQKNKQTNKSFINPLSKLFILNAEYKNNAKPIWSIYLTGHGFPVSSIIPASSQIEKLKANYSNELESDIYKKCSEIDHKRNHKQHSQHVVNCKVHKTFENTKEKIKKLDAELKALNEQKKSMQELHKGIICCLSFEEFQNVLLFFNNNITTALLFYTSCFAGGEHLIKPYIKNSNPVIFNYPIISGTLAENMALQEMPFIKLPPYHITTRNGKKIILEITSADIDPKKKSLKLDTTLQFKKFFKALRKNLHYSENNLTQLIYNLHPYTYANGKLRYDSLANVPHVRLSGQDKFQIIPDQTTFITITPESTKKPKNQSIELKDAPAFLCTDYIPQKINIDVKTEFVPPCISLLPGLAVHAFEEISAPTCSLPGIANAFLFFPELSGCKAFWIKKLRCKYTQKAGIRSDNQNQFVNLNDVIIMRNLFNSDTLKRCSPYKQTPLDTCVYFTSDRNQSYKMTWQGPNINPETMQVNPVQSQDYKKELIAYYPNLKQHVQNKNNIC